MLLVDLMNQLHNFGSRPLYIPICLQRNVIAIAVWLLSVSFHIIHSDVKLERLLFYIKKFGRYLVDVKSDESGWSVRIKNFGAIMTHGLLPIGMGALIS